MRELFLPRLRDVARRISEGTAAPPLPTYA
jgi:hypothetical protein